MSCIGCALVPASFAEKHNPENVFCGKDCQKAFHLIAGKRAREYENLEGNVILISSDNKRFTLSRNAAQYSNTLADLMEDIGDVTQGIPLPNISSDILALIVPYMESIVEQENVRKKDSWAQEGGKIPTFADISQLFGFVMAHEYLDIQKSSIKRVFDILFAYRYEYGYERGREGNGLLNVFNYNTNRNWDLEEISRLRRFFEIDRDEFTDEEMQEIQSSLDAKNVRVIPPRVFTPHSRPSILNLSNIMLKKYILSRLEFKQLQHFRLVHVRFYRLATNYMLEKAKEAFPSIPDEILLSVWFHYESNPGGSLTKAPAKERYVLTDTDLKSVPAEEGKRGTYYEVKDLLQAAVLKYGSIEGIERARQERKAKSEKRASTMQKNKANRQAIIDSKIKQLNDVIVRYNYKRIVTEEVLREQILSVDEMNNFTDPDFDATVYVPMILEWLNRRVEYKLEGRLFDDLFAMVTLQKFKELVASITE